MAHQRACIPDPSTTEANTVLHAGLFHNALVASASYQGRVARDSCAGANQCEMYLTSWVFSACTVKILTAATSLVGRSVASPSGMQAVVAERRWSTQDPGWMVALTLLSRTFSLFLMTSGETETARQQRCHSVAYALLPYDELSFVSYRQPFT